MVDHPRFRHALGARGADIVVRKLFEHGGAHHAGKDGSQRAAHGDRRQHQVRERTRTRDGQPSEFDRKQQNQNGTEGEIWEREAPEADHADDAVVPIIATPGRVNAGRYGEHNRNQQRG